MNTLFKMGEVGRFAEECSAKTKHIRVLDQDDVGWVTRQTLPPAVIIHFEDDRDGWPLLVAFELDTFEKATVEELCEILRRNVERFQEEMPR